MNPQDIFSLYGEEIKARTGATSLSDTQVNLKLPTGQVIPAGVNPGEAPTIVLGGGGVLDRGTTEGASIARGFPTWSQAQIDAKLAPGGYIPGSGAGTSSKSNTGPIGNIIADPVTGNQYILGPQGTYVPYTPPTQPPAPPGATGVPGLVGNVQIDALAQKLKDQADKISAGIASTSSTKILEDLFKKYGVETETSLLSDYNKTILETTQRLRKLPEDIKNTLAGVGVNESQLNRLVNKESQKPLETLRDLMEQKGAAQDRINQALKYVGLFADAAMQDQAAKIEALKFDFETSKFMLGRLDDKQKELLQLALAERKDILSVADSVSGKVSQSVINSILSASSGAEARQKLADSGYKETSNLQVFGSAEGGYYGFDPKTGAVKSLGVGGGKGTVGGVTPATLVGTLQDAVNKANFGDLTAYNALPAEARGFVKTTPVILFGQPILGSDGKPVVQYSMNEPTEKQAKDLIQYFGNTNTTASKTTLTPDQTVNLIKEALKTDSDDVIAQDLIDTGVSTSIDGALRLIRAVKLVE